MEASDIKNVKEGKTSVINYKLARLSITITSKLLNECNLHKVYIFSYIKSKCI